MTTRKRPKRAKGAGVMAKADYAAKIARAVVQYRPDTMGVNCIRLVSLHELRSGNWVSLRVPGVARRVLGDWRRIVAEAIRHGEIVRPITRRAKR